MSSSLFLAMLRTSLAATLLLAGVADADLRASYEVTLSVNGEVHSTRSAQTLASSQAISHELGDYEVELLPVLTGEGEYALQVTVTPIPQEASSVATPVTMSFPGPLGGRMEFTSKFGAAEVNAALVLYQLRE